MKSDARVSGASTRTQSTSKTRCDISLLDTGRLLAWLIIIMRDKHHANAVYGNVTASRKKKYRGRKIIDGNDVVGRAHCTPLGCSAAASPYPSAGRVPPHVGLKNNLEGRGPGNNYPNKRVLARCWARFDPSLWFTGKCGQYFQTRGNILFPKSGKGRAIHGGLGG